MGSDDTGPARQICLACVWPLLDEATGELLRDERGFPRFHCDECTARTTGRWCECFVCPWL